MLNRRDFFQDYFKSSNSNKAELTLEGIFFALNFLPWKFLLVKKMEIEKTKTTKYTTFKTETYNKSGLSFFDFQLFYK